MLDTPFEEIPTKTQSVFIPETLASLRQTERERELSETLWESRHLVQSRLS